MVTDDSEVSDEDEQGEEVEREGHIPLTEIQRQQIFEAAKSALTRSS